jgi:exodeoxyribonuclease VII small subunit
MVDPRVPPDGVPPDGVPSDGVPSDGVPPDIAAMSFEDALAELEQIVRRLEGGQVKLDEAIISYERGAQLKRHCERKLNEAQQRVDRIVVGPEGAVGVEPAKFD